MGRGGDGGGDFFSWVFFFFFPSHSLLSSTLEKLEIYILKKLKKLFHFPGARNWTIIGISFAGCFLFALYLIYDLQLIMGATCSCSFFSGQSSRGRERNLGGKISTTKKLTLH